MIFCFHAWIFVIPNVILESVDARRISTLIGFAAGINLLHKHIHACMLNIAVKCTLPVYDQDTRSWLNLFERIF